MIAKQSDKINFSQYIINVKHNLPCIVLMPYNIHCCHYRRVDKIKDSIIKGLKNKDICSKNELAGYLFTILNLENDIYEEN